jgi:hypothetical protein
MEQFVVDLLIDEDAALSEDLVEIDVDILDPLKLNAMRLSAVEHAEHCGGGIAFHGGPRMQDLLVRGTPHEVRDKTRELKRTLGKLGGNINAIVYEIA